MLLLIGGLLATIGGIAFLVFWIMAIVKAFKSDETLWGVLSIFIPPLAIIFAFIKGHKSLGIKLVITFVVILIGYGLVIAGAVAQIDPAQMQEMQEEIQKQIEAQQQLQQPQGQ
ncbi:hypothetical protein N9Z18_01315 [Verrucomicrobiales bacterium]|nr:hypothetical protein [Verrucomicrobiales bacterium]MDB4358859.1 hypothetical protein [Verrucomicrobiales bacterium]